MAVTPGLRLSTRQRLALTPGMRHSLLVLALPLPDLLDEIARCADANPFLEIRRPVRGMAPIATELAEAAPSLFLDLHRQLSTMRLEPGVFRAAMVIVSELREDGYLDESLAELADIAPDCRPAELAAGLVAVQSCEPAGIGARDLAECLALQLAARGHGLELARRICAELQAFAEGRWAYLARQLGLPRDRLETIAALLPQLDSAPALPESAPPQPLWPDLLVEIGTDGRPGIRLNPDLMPVLRLGAPVAGGSEELARAHDEARLLVAALRARAATLLRLGQHVLARQERHFASAGRSPILPQTQAEAAQDLGLHPATVSRALAGKALAFRGQILPLKTFFSHRLALGEQNLSGHELQRRIRALIAAEPPEAPLADEAIRKQLQTEGVDITRRTVTKYRRCMRIASSYERRRRRAQKPSPAKDRP